MAVNVKSTNWTSGSVNSSNWASSSVNASNWTPGTVTSANWEDDDLSAGALLLQNDDSLLLETGSVFALQ